MIQLGRTAPSGLRTVLNTRVLTAFCVVMAAMLLMGCGDDEMENTGPPPPKAEEKKKGDGPAKKKGVREIESWNEIRPFFLGGEGGSGSGAVRGPVQSLRDPFEPLLVKWVPRVEVEEDEPLPEEGAADEDPIDNEPVATGPAGETQKFKVQDYRVLMIRWGTSLNKAVVVDPEGLEFVITRDMKIGNNNGRVVDITQYEVIVREDSRDEPIVLSISPELQALGSDQEQTTERLFKNQAAE
jgi:hypothetical protein